MDGLVMFCAWSLGVIMLSYSVGKRVDVPAYRFHEGVQVCAKNGGMKSMDHVEVRCANGAIFILKTEAP